MGIQPMVVTMGWEEVLERVKREGREGITEQVGLTEEEVVELLETGSVNVTADAGSEYVIIVQGMRVV